LPDFDDHFGSDLAFHRVIKLVPTLRLQPEQKAVSLPLT
jgi:hypothetical protein